MERQRWSYEGTLHFGTRIKSTHVSILRVLSNACDLGRVVIVCYNLAGWSFCSPRASFSTSANCGSILRVTWPPLAGSLPDFPQSALSPRRPTLPSPRPFQRCETVFPEKRLWFSARRWTLLGKPIDPTRNTRERARVRARTNRRPFLVDIFTLTNIHYV